MVESVKAADYKVLRKVQSVTQAQDSTHKSSKHGEHFTNAFNGDVCSTDSVLTYNNVCWADTERVPSPIIYIFKIWEKEKL